jgi:hypothetical protein
LFNFAWKHFCPTQTNVRRSKCKVYFNCQILTKNGQSRRILLSLSDIRFRENVLSDSRIDTLLGYTDTWWSWCVSAVAREGRQSALRTPRGEDQLIVSCSIKAERGVPHRAMEVCVRQAWSYSSKHCRPRHYMESNCLLRRNSSGRVASNVTCFFACRK